MLKYRMVMDGNQMLTDDQDTILWAHIIIMMVTFGIIFPAGMVLGVGFVSSEDVE